MRNKILWIVILWTLGSAGVSAAPLVVAEDQGALAIGARMMSIGGMTSAMARGSEGLTTNPAALAQVNGFLFSSMYVNLLGDVGNTLAQVAFPSQIGRFKGNMAVGYFSSDVSTIYSPTQGAFNEFSYYQHIAWWGFGMPVIVRRDISVNTGVALKYYAKGFGGSVNASGSGINMDVGIQLSNPDGRSLSAVVRNVIPSSLGGKIVWGGNVEEALRRDYFIGLTLPVGSRVRLAGELQMSAQNPAWWHTGMEYQLTPNISFRGGIDPMVNVTSSSNVYGNVTFGLGIVLAGLRVDYAFHPYGSYSSSQSHYFSIGLGQ